MFKRSLCCLLLPLSIILQVSLAIPSQESHDFGSLERVAAEELAETATPGMALAVVSGDRVVFAKGIGASSVETGAAVTPDMLFQIGSLTKLLTAATLVSLAEEDKINLNRPIGDYVKGLSPKLSQVTAHQLLSQTAGLRDSPGDYGLHEESALADYARSLKDEDRLLEPGKFFSYSNAGYALAGVLIEQVGGKPYADVVSERLLIPLGMSHTTFRPTVAMTYPLANGHSASGKQKPTVVRPLAEDTRIWPAGYAYSSLNDFSRFVIALLNGGKVGGKQALPSAVVTKLLTPHADVPTNVFENGKYGYGLFIHSLGGLQVAEHGGSLPGFSCELRMAPGRRFAVIAFANRDGVRLSKTMNKAFELMLPVKAQSEIASRRAVPMTEEEMTSYTGTYSNRWAMEIFMRDGHLYLKRFGAELPITKVGVDRFSVAPAGVAQPQEFLIVPGANNKPEYIQMFIWTFKRSGVVK